MKLSGRDSAGFLARPPADCPGVLLYGEDAARIALLRADLVSRLLGPGFEAEMRLARIGAGELRSDPAALADAMRARGFFDGPRAVLLDGAADGLSRAVASALEDWQPGDATLVVTAGILPRRSSLRQVFEADTRAVALAVHADPPGRGEIEAELRRAGLAGAGEAAMRDLLALARALDLADFRQTLEKLALYRLGMEGPVEPDDIAACAPATSEAEVDAAIDAAISGRAAELAPLLGRLEAQGVSPVALCIGVARHLRRLHAMASDPKGAEAALNAQRPPVWGPRRTAMLRQVRALPLNRLEEALGLLTDTDLDLRSSRPLPAAALVERCLMRIALMPRN